MAKPRRMYTCQQCGWSTTKWMGRCAECKAWSTLVEEVVRDEAAPVSSVAAAAPIKLSAVPTDRGGEVRIRTGIGELDNVLGGGLVTGSLVLLGGDPGVGKSTLLLMALDKFARRGVPVLYASGEESVRQVKLRADRLGVGGDSLYLLAETRFDTIEATIREHKPHVVVIDSVQTVATGDLTGIPGSVGQVREVSHRAMMLAKSTGTAIWLVGHVTKSGELAGPKVLEHLVDTVLYFEGDGGGPLRVLRAVKNRFGAAGELGLFEMVDEGLREVPDASARLLAERSEDAPGTAVLCAYEGSRPVLAEIQALVGRPSLQIPARNAVGIDRGRLSMLAAVLGKAGLPLHDRDLFLNATGGLRIDEPAADLAIVAAIASSLFDRPIPSDTALFGEVGLVGEVRGVSHPGIRLREAGRHGFRRVLAPGKVAADAPAGVTVIGVRSVKDVLAAIRGE
ncbi:MAG: DNA repair protein RadA [Myxococcota bacterium]